VDAGGGGRPVVRALFDTGGARLRVPRLVRVGQADGLPEEGAALEIEAALDPSQYELDPADYL